MFSLLTGMGFKEIEVGFPSASEVEYDFVRKIIEENLIPEDVTIQVLTQAREHLIKKTFESLKGVKKAIIHFYNSTSTLQRNVVFKMNKEQVKEIAVNSAKLMQSLKNERKGSCIRFQYSPESFTGTELDYALEVCHSIMEIIKPMPSEKLIINLPATVEMSTPNIYADQVEWFSRNLKNRESVLISIHTHNDRGTAVAAAELALLAGADRIEGTLFGNGERTGNMDIVTMALNLFSQGISPELDLTDINKIIEIYSDCTRMKVHERHPYAGNLVYTAFSGSHQDAISKGMKMQKENKSPYWEVPYLPIDPKDVGRSYESIIRINSQSGKGGVAYIMEQEFGYRIPKGMQPEFGKTIQNITDKTGKELPPEEIVKSFENEYLNTRTPFSLINCHIEMDEQNKTKIKSVITYQDKKFEFTGTGNGPIDAFVKGLIEKTGIKFSVQSYFEHAKDKGSDSTAVAYINIEGYKDKKTSWGAGIDENINYASIKAILSALNRI